MINHKVETEGDYSNYAESESVHGVEDSVSSQPGNKGRLESKKKLKKVRSIRLLRVSSMRSSTRRGKSQYENLSMLSSVGTEISRRDTPIEMLDASPSYMKATTSSHAKESFQITQRVLTKRTLTRMSTLKLKRSLSRKQSGRNEMKRKLKSSRSIKLGTVKGPRSTRKLSESIYGCDDQNMESTSDVQPHPTSSGNKSQRVITRRLSLKPVRILKKLPTFKSKNSSIEKGSHMSQSQDSSLHRATCSSILKGSHFPDHIDLQEEESGSQGASTRKVCPYTYCSLHGHRHGNVPPLKRFVSMRRRLLKTQKSIKMDGRPVTRSKKSGNAKKATQRTRCIRSEDGISQPHMRPQDTPASSVTEDGTSWEEDEEKYHLRHNAEVFQGETSLPHMINFEESLGNSLAVEGCTFVATKETNMECCSIATEKDKSDSKVTETGGKDKNISACKKNDESAIVESTSTDVVKSSASNIEIFEGEAATVDKNIEHNYEVMQMISAQEEAKPACTTDMPHRMQERDHKYIKMWHLMYKHAVSSNTGKEENKLPFDGNYEEVRGQEAHSFNGENNSCQDYCESGQDTDDENNNAIQLVQKAFDEILLPESEDLSSDDDVKSRGFVSDELLMEQSEDKRGEGNTSTSKEPPQEETRPKDGNLRSHVEKKITALRMGSKPDQKTPKRWSNLKKLILLKRFVKALEKVRKLNLQRPRHLPADANWEAEKVVLKHQTAEEKKNAEDWMLDYALQKVISKLAPAQRRRVGLLVEAFETILPFQDAEIGPQSSATVETQANPIQSPDDCSDHSKEETDKDNAGDNPMPKVHNLIVLEERCLDDPGTKAVENMPASRTIEEDLNGKESLASIYDNEEMSTGNDNIHLAEVKDSRSWSLCKPVEIISSRHEEVPTDEIVNEVPEDLMSNPDTEDPNSKPESPRRDSETKNLIGANGEQFSMAKSLILKGLVRSFGSNMVGSGAPSHLLDEPTADRKERISKAKLETGTLEVFPTHELSEAPMSAVVEPETQLEKQNYTGLWYLVYKHMKSDIDENNSKSLIDGTDREESGYEGSRRRGTSISYESTPMTNQDMHFNNHGVADPEVELQQIEAIKMVEEAIDSILPDVQDHLSDRQLLNDNTISDNSKESNETERVHSKDLNQKEERMVSGNEITQEQEEEDPAPKEGSKPNQQLPRTWSNLKKVILLRRFIKALEKVRKFNPSGPRYLPIEPDLEAEKVHLRHQDMAERKGTEEWMLDYALRQVVSKLTPARKRKVELLVEAFETVTPTTKN